MILRSLIRLLLFILLLAAFLFIPAGRLDWYAAWALLAYYTVFMLITLFLVDPELIEERTHLKPGAKRWDFVLVGLVIFFLFPAVFIVAGLDAGRFHWSPPFPVWLQAFAFIVLAVASAVQTWAMVTNKFFSSFVRIQKERGHYVVTGGPYHYVRHPGYTGMILVSISIPILLGSLWALIPAVIGDIILIIRTVLEDETLKNELDGYREYASQVRYRLLPGVW